MTTKTREALATAAERLTPATFGARLRALRFAKGFTQKALAAAAEARLHAEHNPGCDHTYLSKLENNHETPSRTMILALAAILEADADELFLLARKPPEGLVGELSSPGARRFYRIATAAKLSDQEWERLAWMLKRVVGSRRAGE